MTVTTARADLMIDITHCFMIDITHCFVSAKSAKWLASTITCFPLKHNQSSKQKLNNLLGSSLLSSFLEEFEIHAKQLWQDSHKLNQFSSLVYELWWATQDMCLDLCGKMPEQPVKHDSVKLRNYKHQDIQDISLSAWKISLVLALPSLSKKTGVMSNHFRCHNKGIEFSLVIIRPWMLVQPRFESATSCLG